MKTLKNHQGKIIALILFLVAIFVYKLFSTSIELAEESLVSQSIGADIIDLNSRIERVNLDPTLFSSAVYKSLVDFSVNIPTQPVGRKNPFDLLGR